MGAAEKIMQLEQQIAELQTSAQYADGQAYRREMARVSAMKSELNSLKANAANELMLEDPFADEPVAEPVDANPYAPGMYLNMSNEDYHRAPGVSKSKLDLIASNPSGYIWQQAAPVDLEKLDALETGTALHCALLEPSEFEKRFIAMPDFNLRTNQGKADRDAFMAEVVGEGKTILTHEVHRQLQLMRDSAFAHPVVEMIMQAKGHNEASIFWNDQETGTLCRVRPDRHIFTNDLGPIIVDVKKCADLSRFERHVEDFRYHVQNAMYLDGYKAHYNETPLFWFLVVDSNCSAGRYRVDVVDLPADWVDAGYELYRRDLATYHHCSQQNDWLHIRTLQRPRWANN